VQTSDLAVLGDPTQEILIRDLPSFLQLGVVPVPADLGGPESTSSDDRSYG